MPLVFILNSKPFLWALLSVPGALIVYRYLATDMWVGDLLHPSGEWSARLMIFALMLTPLSQLLRGRDWVRWLVRRRRAFGVAAFVYALLHLILYLIDMATLGNVLAELPAPGIWTAWAALLLLLPVAAVSNDASMRALKGSWKRVQRLAYPAAVLTLAHWMLVHDNVAAALINFAPLAALQSVRLIRSLRAGSWRGHPTPII